MPFARVAHCAASWLVTPLVEGPETHLEEVARTRLSVHYETGDARVPVLTLATRDAVRLPAAVVTSTVPGPGPLSVGLGRLRQRSSCWRVTRWWREERPSGLVPPAHDLSFLLPSGLRLVGVPVPEPAYEGLHPDDLVGRGPGLTPAGDDLVAGALVAAAATADARFPSWRTVTMRALSLGRTTPVSRALLHHACDGYTTRELAAFVRAVCAGEDPTDATHDLLGVGHTSGAALALGALHTLTTHRLEGAA